MNMETRFTVLLIEVGIAVLVQCVVLVGILIAVRKSTSKMESLADELQHRTAPILEAANAMVQTTRPQIEAMVANLSETSTLLREQVTRVDATLTEIVDRTRLQVVRADELVTRTIDRAETATEFVQHTVVSPVRQVTGIIQGLSTGFNIFFGKRSPRTNGAGNQRDEMFI
jgi:hypothetical protein